MKRIIALVMAAAMMMAMLVACGDKKGTNDDMPKSNDEQQVYNIKFECVLNEASRWYQMGQKMAEMLDERTNGRIKLECYANAQLAGGNQQKGMENLLNNVVQIDCRSSMLWQVFDDKLGVWAIPYFYDSTETILDDLQYADAGKAYGETFEQYGAHLMGLVEYGPRLIATNKPLTSIDDIKGMKIRVASVALHLDGLTAVGANPMAMNWSEMYTGLQQGTVDGMEAPAQVLVDNTIPDVCKYMFDCGWVMDPGVVTVNSEFYNSLPDDLRQIFDEVFKECQEWNIKETRADNEQALKDLSDKYGCVVTKQTADDRAKFVEAMQPVFDKYEQSVGTEYFDLFCK